MTHYSLLIKHLTLHFLFLALTVGCDSQIASEVEGTLLQTHADTYTLTSDGSRFNTEIVYTFENRTGGRVYLPNCNGGFGLHLERLQGENWESMWSPVLLECLSPPIVIERGEVLEFQLAVSGWQPDSNTYPQFSDVYPAGVYRIVWSDALSSYQDRTYPFGPLIRLEHRISNEFEILVE